MRLTVHGERDLARHDARGVLDDAEEARRVRHVGRVDEQRPRLLQHVLVVRREEVDLVQILPPRDLCARQPFVCGDKERRGNDCENKSEKAGASRRL